ncbi:MAG: glycosyltransferase family 2 protein [Oscillospiraceae bacterium]|nr:glycosyltransferase family 2 protein [Oscillospiraceae bacterium]
MRVSVVIPCYNEEKVIRSTFEKLYEVLNEYCKEKGYEYELIFVNDGSKDATLNILKGLEEKYDVVRYVSFSRNFGKEAGMYAGLKYSSGDAVVIIDADLQHPPELIPKLIESFKEGYDQVIARRNRKGDSKFKSSLSKLYYKIVNNMIDVKLTDGSGDFRILSRKAVDAVLSLPENNRFSKGIFSWIGFNEKTIDYDNQLRAEGESKWTLKSLIQYGFDGILSFNNKPLRIIIYIGFIIMLLSLVYVIWTFVRILIHGIDVPGYFTLITAILIIGGLQLVALGIIGEYIGRIYYEVKKRPHFIVEDTNIIKEDKNIKTEEKN